MLDFEAPHGFAGDFEAVFIEAFGHFDDGQVLVFRCDQLGNLFFEFVVEFVGGGPAGVPVQERFDAAVFEGVGPTVQCAGRHVHDFCRLGGGELPVEVVHKDVGHGSNQRTMHDSKSPKKST